MACYTPYCWGDCDECIAEKKAYEESIAECPYRKECHWVVVHTKQDRCTHCNETFDYP